MLKSKENINIDKIVHGIDILEESIRIYDSKLLNIMLMDRTTRKNILWATTDYEAFGDGYKEFSEMMPEAVTGVHATLIQPRITKTQDAQAGRTRNKAEVFTPSWICNTQNNLVDTQWFGRQDVFNVEKDTTWETKDALITFESAKGDWKKYVDTQRMEISCGEAPYLVSRYDTATGQKIPLAQRIGLLDRKMRIVRENAVSAAEWLTWSQRAFESVYGYEYQGDNLLLARENLLYSYIEYYYDKFEQMPEIAQLRNIARIISWNIWQMDGMKYVVPGSCKPEDNHQITIFEFIGEEIPSDTGNGCPGCVKGDIYRHTGIYCKIMDWRIKRSRTFISMLKGVNEYGKL